MLLFWGVVIALVVLAVRGFTTGKSGRNEPVAPRGDVRQTPLEILQTRYAKGEISRDEYETMRRDLQAS
jgi:putative membrane protein